MPGKEGAPKTSIVERRKSALTANEQEVLSIFSKEEQELILSRKKTLSTLGYFIGKDFELPIVLGLPSSEGDSGWFWAQRQDGSSYMQINAQDLLEKPLDYLRFVTSHEAGHRRITRTRDIPKECIQEPGFNTLHNYLEDPRDNNFVADAYPNFREQMTSVYAEMMEESEKEFEKISLEKVGTIPRFQLAAREYLAQWWNETQGKPVSVNEKLPQDVQKVLRVTLESAQDYWWRYPSKEEADSGEKIIEKYAKSANHIVVSEIWPHMKTLIDEDIKDQKTRKAIEQMAEGKEEKGKGEGSIPEGLDKTLTGEEREELNGLLEEFEQSGGKPIDPTKLSPELKEKIEQYIEKLVEELRNELERQAREALEELEREIEKELAGKIEQTYEDSLPSDQSSEKEHEEKHEKFPDTDPRAQKELQDKLKEISADTNEYDRSMREVLPVIDRLENDLREIFVHRRAHAWETGYKSGKKLDIKKRIQEKAKGVSAFESRAWQKREAPGPKDYAITLLVDLSGSMEGEKIEETFKATVALAEVLNKLSIKVEILGFNDRIYEYQNFGDSLSDDKRQHMTSMLHEVSDFGSWRKREKAEYNDDGWALEQASQRLSKQGEAIKVLITLSDGLPVPSPAHSGSEFDLHKVVSKITETTDQKLIGLGIGRNTHHVSEYYPNSLASIPVEEMAGKLADLIRTVIEDPNSF